MVIDVYFGSHERPCSHHERPNTLSRRWRSPLGRPCVLAGLDDPHRPWSLPFQARCALQRHFVPRGHAASRPSAQRTRVFVVGYAAHSSLGFSERFVLRPKRSEPLAQGSTERMAAKRRAGALPPKSDRALEAPSRLGAADANGKRRAHHRVAMMVTPALALLLLAPALLASSGFGSPRPSHEALGGSGWTPSPRLWRPPKNPLYFAG